MTCREDVHVHLRTNLGRAEGTQALVTDGILPTSYLIKCKRDKSFKQWLIQVVLEKVEERYGIELSRG